MQLYIIRHGQSENNASWDQRGDGYKRVQDPELTDIGRQQALLTAQYIAHSAAPSQESAMMDKSDERLDLKGVGRFQFTHLYTSLMVRAVATGTAISQAIGLPLVAWKDWHESGGIFLADPETGEPQGLPGHNRVYFEQHYPDLVLPDTLDERGWWNRPIEERAERPPRARRVLGELLARHGSTDDRVAVISHGGFSNYFIWAVLGLDRDQGIWFMMNNTAISRIDFVADEQNPDAGDRIRVIYSNRTSHLPADLVT